MQVYGAIFAVGVCIAWTQVPRIWRTASPDGDPVVFWPYSKRAWQKLAPSFVVLLTVGDGGLLVVALLTFLPASTPLRQIGAIVAAFMIVLAIALSICLTVFRFPQKALPPNYRA